MSTPDESPILPDPDRAASWWMDGDAEAEEPRSASAAAFSPGSAIEAAGDRARFRAADLQLVHALLLHLNHGEATRRQARIERAMQAVRQGSHEDEHLREGALGRQAESAGKTGSGHQVRLFVRWAVAASLLVAAATWFYTVSTSNSALAALEQVVQAMDDPADRTYEIWLEPVDRPGEREPGGQRDRRSDVPPPEDRRPGLDGAILYVRGGQFVLYRSTPGGRLVINGSNGRENWLVRPERPVLISDSPTAFRIPMPEDLATVPLVDVRESLALLRRGYEIEELPAEKLGDGDLTLWRHLRAEKTDRAAPGPNAISLWFHPETNVVGRIRFEQMHLQGRREPRSMTITLTSLRPLPVDWFEHSAHHAPDAAVERLAP